MPKTAAQYKEVKFDLPPRFFVFAYGGWKSEDALAKNFRLVSENRSAHIHGVCVLCDDDSFYLYHRAYKNDEEWFSPVHRNGFRRFLMNMPSSLMSMLPIDRAGNGFDPINLGNYEILESEVG
jgi:hypothetical protein